MSEQRAKAPDTPAGTQAIGRAMAVLRLFIEAEGDVQVTEIVQRLGLTPGTAHRVVGALAAEGFLSRNPATEGYYLGSTAILLGQAAQRALGADRAMPLLKQLNEETNESVNLVVRDGGESVVVMRVQSTLPLRFEQHPGARFPLYSTASGKAMMAFAEDVDDYLAALPGRLAAVTPNTVRTPGEFAAELERTRERGFSIDNEENVEGVRCIGAPVLGAGGHAHAAVVIQVPAVRLPDTRVRELAPRLKEIAAQVAQVVPSERTMQAARYAVEDGDA
ncbi:IclR family transcriptional regulator [Streptomyces sp. NPDC050315]|uniref:IclR family transcriptional regulator n=1 Tax=Streptomyces sp. NPDC050315 TaxID=3155039 RepID=UPI0034380D35